MAQVRETIELLTKILRGNGTLKLKAETFRLAKFNKNEATEALWRLLFQLIYFINYGDIDDVSVKAESEFTKEELSVYVKQELQKRGFLSMDFAAVPNDFSRGSRELLLAFGWLFCRECIVKKFMNKCSSPVDEDTSNLHDILLDEEVKPTNTLLSPLAESDPCQRVEQMIMLNGKLRLNLRTLYGLQRQKAKLTYKVHEATQGMTLDPERSHLSVMEVYMLRHPELLKKILHLLEKDNDRLQCLLKWHDQEEVFWNWMESVLDLKLKEQLQETSYQGSDCGARNVVSEASLKGMHDARQHLEEAIIMYEKIIQQLESMWETRSADVSEQELDSLLASIDEEISFQKANLALSSPLKSNYTEPRFHLVKNSSKKMNNIRRVMSSNQTSTSASSVDGIHDIEDEIAQLRISLQNLESDLQERHDSFRMEMASTAARFPDVLCVPPMSERQPHHGP